MDQVELGQWDRSKVVHFVVEIGMPTCLQSRLRGRRKS